MRPVFGGPGRCLKVTNLGAELVSGLGGGGEHRTAAKDTGCNPFISPLVAGSKRGGGGRLCWWPLRGFIGGRELRAGERRG